MLKHPVGGEGAYTLLNKILVKDLFDDSFAHRDTGWVTDPGVELSIRLIRDQHAIAKEVPCCLRFLGESNHIGRRIEVPVSVSPEFARGAESSLDLVHDHDNIMLLGNVAEALEELR